MVHFIFMNGKKFDSLPKHLQDLILESQKKAELPMKDIQRANIAEDWRQLNAAGVKHIKWSPEDTKSFLEKVNQVTFKARSKKMSKDEAAKIMKMMGY